MFNFWKKESHNCDKEMLEDFLQKFRKEVQRFVDNGNSEECALFAVITDIFVHSYNAMVILAKNDEDDRLIGLMTGNYIAAYYLYVAAKILYPNGFTQYKEKSNKNYEAVERLINNKTHDSALEMHIIILNSVENSLKSYKEQN